MATVLRTDLNAVLAALTAWLTDALEVPTGRLLVVADEEDRYHPQGDWDLLIRPRSQRWDRPREGGGRHDNRVRRRTTVTLRTRLLLDESSQDVQWLTDAANGHFAREHLLFDALEQLLLEDKGGNALLYEPVHLEEASQAEKPPKRAGWGQASYSFDLCFVLDLDQSRL